MCIAPVLAARALGDKQVKLTIGNDANTVAALEAKGAHHVDTLSTPYCGRPKQIVATTPAYMLAQSITEAESGINQLVEAVLNLRVRVEFMRIGA